MNLQENIERIHEIMGGVITEDRKEMVIKNMIDSVGIENTFKMVGDYDLIDSRNSRIFLGLLSAIPKCRSDNTTHLYPVVLVVFKEFIVIFIFFR